MYARVTTFKTKSSTWDDAVKAIEAQVSGRVSHNPAVRAGYWMGDKDKGKLVVVVVFDSEEALHAAAGTAAQLRDLALQFGVEPEGVDELSVVAHVEHIDHLPEA